MCDYFSYSPGKPGGRRGLGHGMAGGVGLIGQGFSFKTKNLWPGGKAVMDPIEQETLDPDEDDLQIYTDAMAWLTQHAANYEADPGDDFDPGRGERDV
jgi:hypothetical protein